MFSDNKIKQKVVKNANNFNAPVTINVFQLNQAEKAFLKDWTKESLTEKGVPLIREDASKIIEKHRQIEKLKENKTFLDFFKDKISSADLQALRASIYLKQIREEGQSIEELKSGIIHRFGSRGNNISNLYSAGYFHSQIKPLYEEMASQAGFNPEQFKAEYEIIVTQSPHAVFINSSMTPEQAKQAVINRMKISVQYGIKQLNIHGLGTSNVKKIYQVLERLKPECIESYQYVSGDTYINARAVILTPDKS